MSLSWMHFKRQDIDNAFKIAREVRALCIRQGGYGLPEIEHNIGIYLRASGHPEQAARIWERSLHALEGSRKFHEKVSIIEEIALFHLVNKNDPDEAERRIFEALRLSVGPTAAVIQGRLFRVLGRIEQQRCRFAHARRWYEVGIQLFESLQAHQEIAETLTFLQKS